LDACGTFSETKHQAGILNPAAILARLETYSCHCASGDRRWLASRGIQVVLEMDLAQSYAIRQETYTEAAARTHLSYGHGEQHLGCAAYHGELKMLGYEISERTVLRWMRKAPRNAEPARRWASFLSSHREAIAAMDSFTVPTVTFGVLYGFFVIAHERRRILHFNVTGQATSAWVVQQLREVFPYDSAPSYLIFDRGTNFNDDVVETIKNFGIQPKGTSFQSPWQNGIAERFVGNCRRDLLGHVIVVNERHLKRFIKAYISYYHEGRTHLGLGKKNPAGRKAEENPEPDCRVVSMPRLGGLHHRYRVAA
jgi:transposase InsO family protein